MNTEQTSPAPTVSSERLLADLEARRQTALKKIRAHSDAWKNGDPGEADIRAATCSWMHCMKGSKNSAR